MFFCSFFPPLFSYIKSNRKGLKYDVCISPFRRWGLRRKFLIRAQEQVITGDPVLKKKERKKEQHGCWKRLISSIHSETGSILESIKFSAGPPNLLSWPALRALTDLWWRLMGIIDLPGARLWLRHKTDDLTRGIFWRSRAPVLHQLLGQGCHGFHCGLFELGARWSRHFSMYLNNQTQI